VELSGGGEERAKCVEVKFCQSDQYTKRKSNERLTQYCQ
jgi:hypothetical protein